MSTCFAPLLGWVLRLWKSEKRQLPLVMDATSLGKRWTILAISVVMSGCAIPLTSIDFLPLGAGMFPRAAFLSFATFLFLLRFLLLHS